MVDLSNLFNKEDRGAVRMRTRGQGQAAVPRGEGAPPKAVPPAWAARPGPYGNTVRTVTACGALS